MVPADSLVLLGYKQIYMDTFYFLTLYIFYDTQSIENGLRFAQINFKYEIKNEGDDRDREIYSEKGSRMRKNYLNDEVHKNV